MRMTEITVGETYAISNQRDAVPGTPGWAFTPGIVREKNVARPDDEKVSRQYRDPSESRTDAVVVDVVDPDDMSHVVRTEVVRTRDVKALWDDHAALLAKNLDRMERERRAEEAAREKAVEQVASLAEGYLSPSQTARVLANPGALATAERTKVDRVSDNILIVRQNRGDVVVLSLPEHVYTDLTADQSHRGVRAAKVSRLSVVAGEETDWTLLAAVLFLRSEVAAAAVAV